MKIYKLLLMNLALCITFKVIAQSEQAGIDLANSFPKITLGNIKPDVPADGFYWDKDDPGWGVNIELQSRNDTESGYFLFGTGFFYKENGSPFWCAFSEPYLPNADVNQWRDDKQFSNLPSGHNDIPMMSDQVVPCYIMTGGTALGSDNKRTNSVADVINIRLVWRNPSDLEITPEGGITHYSARMGFSDDLNNPSLDWVMNYQWQIVGASNIYVNTGDSDPNTNKKNLNDNLATNFEKFDADEQDDLKNYVGHEQGFVYYISTQKLSTKFVNYTNYDTSLAGMFEPYVNGGISNNAWVVLVHNLEKQTVSLFTVGGEKASQSLDPDWGTPIKFIAKVNPDADVLDFYALKCKGETLECDRTARTYRNTDMANWSPQNVHRTSMKMFKFQTGGKAYLYQPNVGESDSQSMNRIKNQLIDDGILEE